MTPGEIELVDFLEECGIDQELKRKPSRQECTHGEN